MDESTYYMLWAQSWCCLICQRAYPEMSHAGVRDWHRHTTDGFVNTKEYATAKAYQAAYQNA